MERGGSAYGVTRRRVGPLCHRWDHVGVGVEWKTPEAERGSIQRDRRVDESVDELHED
jgi:hypothetical protein